MTESNAEARAVMRQYFAGTLPADQAMEVHRRLMDDEGFFRAAMPVLSNEVFKSHHETKQRRRRHRRSNDRPVRALRLADVRQ